MLGYFRGSSVLRHDVRPERSGMAAMAWCVVRLLWSPLSVITTERCEALCRGVEKDNIGQCHRKCIFFGTKISQLLDLRFLVRDTPLVTNAAVACRH